MTRYGQVKKMNIQELSLLMTTQPWCNPVTGECVRRGFQEKISYDDRREECRRCCEIWLNEQYQLLTNCKQFLYPLDKIKNRYYNKHTTE